MTPVVVVREPQTNVTVHTPASLAVVISDEGTQGPPGQDTASVSYTHEQQVAAAVWEIHHNLGRKPLIFHVVDSAGQIMRGPEIEYVSDNHARLTWHAASGGTATVR